jgi:hypothetical protein
MSYKPAVIQLGPLSLRERAGVKGFKKLTLRFTAPSFSPFMACIPVGWMCRLLTEYAACFRTRVKKVRND